MNGAVDRRVVLGPSSLSLRDFPFLGPDAGAELRDFVARAFSVNEVQSVEIDRSRGLARVRYGAVGDLADLWRRLGLAIRLGGARATDGPARLFLDAPGAQRIVRVGETLSTFRVRVDAADRIRVWHPLLRRLPHMVFRLEEELAALPGVQSYRINRLTAQAIVRVDPHPRAAERLAQELERAWPRLLGGVDGPPPARRLMAASGLLALSAAGTFLVPELLPIAVVAVALYRAPSVIAAVRELRRRQVGLSALHATGFVFFMITRSPLRSMLSGIMTQLWPKLARDKAIAAQRRLLAPYRRRPRWAWRVLRDGEAIETRADALVAGDLIVVRRGDTVPADGVVERGLVATADAAGTNADPTDREAGDVIRAGELVIDGEAFVRVEQPAERSAAAILEAQLPHGLFTQLPALDEVERIGDRNAQPTLLLALATLATRQRLRPAQGIIRPDYVTAPRLGAQLGAQQAYVEALRGGVLFRHPAALDWLARAEIFVLDDTALLVERPIEIGRIVTNGISDTELLAAASVTFDAPPVVPAGGWGRKAASEGSVDGPIRRRAGRAWYQDREGRGIEVVSAALLRMSDPVEPEAPTGVRRSVWVLRDGERLGRIDFREGAARPARGAVDQLRAAAGRPIRIIHLSAGDKDAAAELGAGLGADFALGGLSPRDKAHVIRGLAQRAVWIGDGTAPDAAAMIAASDVSLSTAAPSEQEQADAVLLAGLEGIAVARTIARRHRATIAADYRLVYAANLSGATGAMAAGLGSLDVALLSNAATAVIYAGHVRRLRRLKAEQDLRARAILAQYSL